jgi:hypothetical protein
MKKQSNFLLFIVAVSYAAWFADYVMKWVSRPDDMFVAPTITLIAFIVAFSIISYVGKKFNWGQGVLLVLVIIPLAVFCYRAYPDVVGNLR